MSGKGAAALAGSPPRPVERPRSKGECHTDACFALDVPVAPAIMIGEEIVVEGDLLDPASPSRGLRPRSAAGEESPAGPDSGG